jgi:malonyl-ACP decarboxylase
MKRCGNPDVQVTGVGITSALGQGRTPFAEALFAGRHNFGVLARPGRQFSSSSLASLREEEAGTPFVGAEIDGPSMPPEIPESALRTASFPTRVALATLQEAWLDADLDDADPTAIGLFVGGSNFQQRDLVKTYESYQERAAFLRPTYGMSFLDTDVCGLCTELFGIKGFACTVGGASASGQLAVIQAVRAVRSGEMEIGIALGAMMDLSYWELHALRALGAMGSARFANRPELAARPFDRDRDGFIYGEACGAIVVERKDRIRTGKRPRYACIGGYGVVMDGNRNPNPSLEGEVSAIEKALELAGLPAGEIDYVNPHGTGSFVGDQVELDALMRCGLNRAHINATKSLTGHSISAAGVVEIVATIIQMEEQRLHPNRNLDNPIASDYNWVPAHSISHEIINALSLSFGFGGINTAICLTRQ